MNISISAIKSLLIIFIFLSISACGYKPSSKFARHTLGEKISTSVVISIRDPENTVILKDAIDESVVEVFHASLTSKANSDSHLVINIKNQSYIPIQYNIEGYVVSYRMNVVLNIVKFKNGRSKNYLTSGTYDFSIQPNAVVTDQERFEAIKFSAKKAIESFIAQVSAEGARAKK